MKLRLLFSLSFILVGASLVASAAIPVVTVDENGNGTVNGAALPYTLGSDPTPGAPPVSNLLTYSPLPFRHFLLTE